MKKEYKTGIFGIICLLLFTIWTVLVLTVDVKPVGIGGTDIGFSSVNTAFHDLTGVHWKLYDLTDILGAVPFAICLGFAFLGLYQWIGRKSFKAIDTDLLILGGFYIAVILSYLFFEKVVINYRTVYVEGVMEASYPSSTTLLSATVVPALMEQITRRVKGKTAKIVLLAVSGAFGAFMVVVRLICGVHWLTDILGGLILSAGLFLLYLAFVRSERFSHAE